MEESSSIGTGIHNWALLAVAIGLGIPAVVISWLAILTGKPHLLPWMGTIVFGAGIVGAAALLAWASEVAEIDISQGLALAIVALVAVLPEYAVDIFLAWQAGNDPSSLYSSYTTANMTGGNRLIVGLGWPLVVLLYWFKRKQNVSLSNGISTEIAFLIIGALYAVFIVVKGEISLWDTAVLLPLFGVYIWLSGRGGHSDSHLIGPSRAIASFGVTGRRIALVLIFLYAIGVIIFSTELFAKGLIDTGAQFGIDEFVLIQWLAPLASEAPEMLIASYFALRGAPGAALIMLVSATVNQWTLLLGSLPIAYSLGFGGVAALPLTTGESTTLLGVSGHRQQVELILTMAQTVFAIALVLRLYASWRGMGLLLALFITQLVFSGTEQRLAVSALFLSLAMLLLIVDGRRRDGIRDLAVHVAGAFRGRPVQSL